MATKATEAVQNEMVSLVIPREPGGEEMLFLALNGRSYNIPRGKVVQLPRAVANVYYESIAANEAAMNKSDEFQAEMKIIHGAP